MSPKQKFNLVIEPAQLAVLKAIEERTGARISEQIRRAIQAYIESQTVLTKAELKKLLGK
jgi:hypothetical protein